MRLNTEILEDEINEATEPIKKKYRDEIQRKIIIPFCDKYQIKFICGNGTYVFFPIDKNNVRCPKSWLNNYGNLDEYKPTNKEVFRLFSTLTAFFKLVDYFEDYTPKV